MTSQQYQPPPLPNPSTSIRLLSIVPGWPSDPLRVRLQVIPDRTAAPPYDALSYCWGTSQSANPVICNGAPTTVTENLASALLALRPLPASGDAADHGIRLLHFDNMMHSSQREWKAFARNLNETGAIEARRADPSQSPKMIWIDALCINQADKDECAEQVKGMRGVYQSAQTVRIWLGAQLVTRDGMPCVLPEMKTAKVDEKLGRVRLAEFGHVPVVLSFLAQALRNEGEYLKRLARSGPGHSAPSLEQRGFPPSKAPEWAIFRCFLQQPWFHRVWIIQEAVMARDAVVMMGDWEFEWDALARAIQILDATNLEASRSLVFKRKVDNEIQQGIELSPVQYITEIRNKPGKLNHLLHLLNDGRGRKATQALDHVFAVLGIAVEAVKPDQPHKDFIDIDYSKPAADVFRDATWFILFENRTLLPLLLVELIDNPSTENCPSWVPHWDQPRKAPALDHTMFDAVLGRKMDIGTHDINSLRVSGHEFERIRVVSIELEDNTYDPAESEFQRGGLHYPPRKEEIRFVTSAWNQAKSYRAPEARGGLVVPEYQSQEEVWHAFIHTLCANTAGMDKRADATGDMIKAAGLWFDKYVEQFPPTSSFLAKAWSSVEEIMYGGTVWTFEFQSALLRASFSRRFFITSSGFMGLGPASLRADDLVAIVFGVPLPLVLRSSPTSRKKLQVVGCCYVHGIMDGELLEAYGDRPPSRFILI